MKNKSPAAILRKFAWINGYIVVLTNLFFAVYMYQGGKTGLQLVSVPLILVSVTLWVISLSFIHYTIKKKMRLYDEQNQKKK